MFWLTTSMTVKSGRQTVKNEVVMTFDSKIYGKLLSDVLPGKIDSDEEYQRIEEIFDKLISKENLSPEENRLFLLLADLLENYDKDFMDDIPAATPRETLAYLIKENGLRQADLVGIFPSQSLVSEVLNGKREITKTQAKALSERFKLRIEAFI